MNMIAIPKQEYKEILKRQARTEAAIARLARTIGSYVEETEEELRPEVAVRIERRSKAMNAGKGKRFKNMREVRAYFRSL